MACCGFLTLAGVGEGQDDLWMDLKYSVVDDAAESVELSDIICNSALTFTASAKNSRADVTVDDVIGFRLLDEGDLLDFWSAGISSQKGWIFEIAAGGWLAQESLRAGFVSQQRAGVREFLVIGVDWCLSLLALSAPKVAWR